MATGRITARPEGFALTLCADRSKRTQQSDRAGPGANSQDLADPKTDQAATATLLSMIAKGERLRQNSQRERPPDDRDLEPPVQDRGADTVQPQLGPPALTADDLRRARTG